MDDRRFDALARSLASRAGRRAFLLGALSAGVALGAAAFGQDVDAARRGFSGPRLPRPRLGGEAECSGVNTGCTTAPGYCFALCNRGACVQFACGPSSICCHFAGGPQCVQGNIC